MKAILIEGSDLRWGEVATPEPGVGEVRIRVRASAVNRADLVQRAGAYAPPPGASPSWRRIAEKSSACTMPTGG